LPFKQIRTKTHALGSKETTQAGLEPTTLGLAGEDVTPLPPRPALANVVDEDKNVTFSERPRVKHT
jgi:hypothetical protein